LAACRLFAQPALPTTNPYVSPIANPYSGSWIYYTTDSVSGLGYLNGASIPYVMTASNNVVSYVNTATNGLVTAAVTNGLATTNYVLALGLNETNFTLVTSNSLSVTFSNQFTAKSGTNINYSQITNAPVIPSTNGFVTAAVTNGLATTNFVLGQGFVTGSITNSLVSIIYLNAATNGFVGANVTNGLATTNYVLALGLNETNFTLATSNSLSVTYSNQLAGKSGTNINYSQITNAPVIPSTNGFVTAAVTNGLATTNFVLLQGYATAAVTNGLATTNYVLALGLNETNFTLATSNSLSVTYSNQLAGKSGTNINYSQITNAPVIPSTNGFVTAAVTNGLATTNYVQSITNGLATTGFALTLGLNETNFTVATSNSLSLTFSNQLAAKSGTNINYSQITNAPVIPSTNGFVTAAVTNGLATTNYVQAITNGLATTGFALTLGLNETNFTVATSNSLSLTFSNQLTAKSGTNINYSQITNAPVIPTTNGFVTAAVTNGLATTNYVQSITNGLATTNYVLAMGLNDTNFTLATSNSLSVAFSNQLAAKSGTNINYSQITNPPVIPSTNGYVTAAVTNGLATTNFVLLQGYATATVTNGLATTNYVLTLGLNDTNFTLATSNNLSLTFSNQLTAKSGTNINYSQITNAPVIPSTNGFVTTAVTNGLATTNFVLLQGYATASVTNGLATTNYVLALGFNDTNFTLVTSNNLSVTFSNQLTAKSGTNINYSQITNAPVIPSTNGFVSAAVTNGLATTNFVLLQGYATASVTNGLATTNYVLAMGLNDTNFTLVTSNNLSVTFSNQLTAKSGTNINYSQITNAPVIPSTNGFVTAAVTNGLATTNYVQVITNGFVSAAVTNGLATTNYVLALGLNETNFTLTTSNSLSVTFSNQLTAKSGTNINYSQITNAPVIPSTNGFVTAAVTNGLATTNYVQSITNGLATTNYVQAITNTLRIAPYGTVLKPIATNQRYTNGLFRSALTIEYFQANGANPAINGGAGLYTNFNSGEGFNTFIPAASATNTAFATFFLSPSDIVLVTNVSTGTGVFMVTNSVLKTQ
jgi:CRISPR/Cas system CMR subunit Cmr6 (Cas7 group RAMP superfamily)